MVVFAKPIYQVHLSEIMDDIVYQTYKEACKKVHSYNKTKKVNGTTLIVLANCDKSEYV